MTTPVPIGYADFERLQPISDQLLLQVTQTAPNTGDSFGPFYVGNIRGLRLLFNPSSAAGTIFLDYFKDAAMTQSIGVSSGNSLTGQPLQRTIRPFAPFLRFRVFPSIAATLDYTFTVATVADTRVPLITPDGLRLISQEGANLPGNSTVITPFARSVYGPMYWHINTNSTSWIARLQTVDGGGVVRTFARADATIGPFRGMLLSPGGGLQLSVQNLTAAASLYDSFVTGPSDESA